MASWMSCRGTPASLRLVAKVCLRLCGLSWPADFRPALRARRRTSRQAWASLIRWPRSSRNSAPVVRPARWASRARSTGERGSRSVAAAFAGDAQYAVGLLVAEVLDVAREGLVDA